MKLTFKKFLENKKISQSDYEGMDDAAKADLFTEYLEAVQKEFDEALKLKQNSEDLAQAIKDAFAEEFKDKYTPDQIKQKFDEIDEVVKQFKDGLQGQPGSGTGFAKEFADKKEEIKKLLKGAPGVEMLMKALTTRSSIATNVVSGYILPDIGQLGVKERSLYNVLPKITLESNDNSGGTIKYRDWDEATIARAAEVVAEGAAFPESTAAFKDYTLQIRKIGDTLPVTEEFFEDEQLAAAELEMFVNVNVETKVDDQLVNGNNTGEQLKGYMVSIPAYTATASGIASPNLKDLVIKMRNAITRPRGSKYSPDMVLVASSTMEDLVLAKDANNNYIFNEDLGTLGGMAVVVDENLADNEIAVGDRRFARIYEKTGTVISRGYVGDQFKEDEVTIKARKRLALLIREADKTGFLKVTDVDAALTTLGT